jgi:hypothetical protein
LRIEQLDEGVGRIVKGVNTTPDVGVDQTRIEAAKFGNKVDKDGRPPTLTSSTKGKSTNVLYNLGMVKEDVEPRYTAAEWAIMEGGHTLEETTPQTKEPGRIFSALVAEGGMKRMAQSSSNKADRMASNNKLQPGLDTFKKKPGIEIDNRDGWGAVPWNQEVDYRGLRVKMKPSVFINLAASRNGEPPVPKVVDYVKGGGAIGAPFLQIFVDEDDSQIPEVRGHEGRSRMAAILEVQGDVPVETHLFFQGKVNRNRHITPEFVEKIQRYLISENDKMVRGPLFEI